MDFFYLTLLGGLLALDGTSVGQFMICRPLVAGVLSGWVLGDPVLGLLVGGLLEIFFLPAFPVGGAGFPEEGPSTVIAVATASANPDYGGLALGVLLAFLWARLGGRSIKLLRRANGRLVPDPSRGTVTVEDLVWRHTLGIALDFLRGAALTAAGLGVGLWAGGVLEGVWPLDGITTLGLLALGASVPAGALVKGLGGWKERGGYFIAGFLVFFFGSLVL